MTRCHAKIIYTICLLLYLGGISQAALIDNGDGTVTDTSSGLMWEQPNVIIFSKDWVDANDYCNNKILANRFDWRLPTKSELQMLLTNNSLEVDSMFPDNSFGHYWTSTDGYSEDEKMYIVWSSGTSGSENKTDSNKYMAVRVDVVAPVYPNLKPYQPSGWSDKIVVSNSTENNTDSTVLSENDTLYIDWAVLNDSSIGAGSFVTSLYVDNVLVYEWNTGSLLANYYTSATDYNIGSLSVGSHAIRIVTDSGQDVQESNGADNEYTKEITVKSVDPDIVPFTPSGWTAPLVLSMQQDTTISEQLDNSGSIYLDWAVLNDSVTAIGSFRVQIVVDGSPWYYWTVDSLDPGYYISVLDADLGIAAAGQHTIVLDIDPLDEVSEGDELNNQYQVTGEVVDIYPTLYTLNVAKAGTGSGTVSSSPSGISCGADCAEDYDEDTPVTLTATAATGSSFTGWSGACSGIDTCQVTMDSAKSVTATFDIIPSTQYALSVSKDGSGTGTIFSSPSGISCDDGCSSDSGNFDEDTLVTLTADAAAGSTFVGWTGDCSGMGTCQVTLDAVKSVSATFDTIPSPQYTLLGSISGTGTGTVTSSPVGISCGTDCSEDYDENTLVTLTATDDVSSTFAGWTGDCSGSGLVTMDGDKTCTATFTLNTYSITTNAGNNGSISPTGSVTVDHGSSKTFTIEPATDYHIIDVLVDGGSVGAVSSYTFDNVTNEHSIAASFAIDVTYTLNVTKAGTGTGTVTSSTPGINCGTDCSEVYDDGDVVTLTATDDASSTFIGWTGDCSGTDSCQVTMNSLKSVTATFDIIADGLPGDVNGDNQIDLADVITALGAVSGLEVGVKTGDVNGDNRVGLSEAIYDLRLLGGLEKSTLNATKTGNGKGVVISDPAGISCEDNCTSQTNDFTIGTDVILSATSSNSSSFIGWSGACTGTGTCQITMDTSKFVTARFADENYIECGAAWEWVNPLPQGNTFKDIVWNGSLYVAVGEKGTILTSYDLDTWTTEYSGTFDDLTGIVWDGGKFVVISNTGPTLTSLDGKDWTLGASNGFTLDIAWNGSQFIAVGASGLIKSSLDGITWTTQVANTTDYINSIVWSGQQFVAVGQNGVILTSADGVNWNVRSSGTTSLLYGVAWNGLQYVAVGQYNTILTSTNGITWTTRMSESSGRLQSVEWNGSQYVAVGWSGDIFTSPTGVNWTYQSLGVSTILESVIWDDSQYITIGDSGTVFTSYDGISWSRHGSGEARTFFDVAQGSNVLVAVSQGGIYSSPNGTIWTKRHSETSGNSVIWTGTQYVVVGGYGTLLNSLDGISWSDQTLGTNDYLYGVTSNNSLIVAVGRDGVIYSSPDAISWTKRVSGTINDLNGVVWNGSLFVAVGNEGTILASTDGVNWNLQQSGEDRDFKDVTWNNGQFVAVGWEIYTSPNGVTWSQQSSEASFAYSVSFNDGQYIVGDLYGDMFTSQDGINWTTRETQISQSVLGLTWNGSQFVAVGRKGTIAMSNDCSN